MDVVNEVKGALLCTLLCTLSLTTSTVNALHVSSIQIPRAVEVGKTVRLDCNYGHEMGSVDPVYSVKWYRGLDQFYEHLPQRFPEPKKAFRYPGLNVDKEASSSTSVVLLNVSHQTSGVFKCEVMGDKPTFETDSMMANMTVVDKPVWGPLLTGAMDGEVVRPGQMLGLSCSLGHTNPPANVTWLLNDQTVEYYHIQKPFQQTYRSRNGPLIKSEIRLLLAPSFFKQGVLKVTCKAQLAQVFRKSVSYSLLSVNRPKPSVFGWFSSGCASQSSHWTTHFFSLFLFLFSPQILPVVQAV